MSLTASSRSTSLPAIVRRIRALALGAPAMLAGLGFASSANASLILASHSGQTDPATEGWSAFAGGASSGGINDAGTDAWQISTTPGAQYLFYLADQNVTDMNNALTTTGWRLSAKVKVETGVASGGPGDIHMQVGFGASTLWVVIFGREADGDQTVYDYDGNVAYVSSGGVMYHQYDLVYNPATGKASLLVDGVTQISDFPSRANFSNSHRVLWGDGFGGGDPSTGNYASLEFAIPEPASLALLAVGAAVVSTRKRRAASPGTMR